MCVSIKFVISSQHFENLSLTHTHSNSNIPWKMENGFRSRLKRCSRRRSHISPCLWKISPCQNHVVDFTLFVVDFTLSCFTLFVVENTLFERSRKYLVWGRFYLVKYQKIGKMCQNVWVNWRECFALYCRRSPSFKNFRNSTNHWKSYFQHTHTIIWS